MLGGVGGGGRDVAETKRAYEAMGLEWTVPEGVNLALDPDTPPVERLRGIRRIITSVDALEHVTGLRARLDRGRSTGGARELLEPGRDPIFGPTKTDTGRTVDIAAETVALLRTHRKAQAELKMRNRKAEPYTSARSG